MWFIPTRNRPRQMQELILAMRQSGCVPEAAIMMDGCEYNIEFPDHWHIHHSDEHLELSGALNALFAKYPDEKSYGFITDHGRPISENWAGELEQSAGEWGIALCDDGHPRKNPSTGNRRITEATCFGGELVRTTGWVWPDFVTHLYGDDVWEEIGHELKLINYREDVKVKSLQFSAGEFPIDENHSRMFKGEPYPAKDQEAYLRWNQTRKKYLLKEINGKIHNKPLTIACVKTGTMYGAEYVNILKDMVCRNLPANLLKRIVCFTDDPAGIDEVVQIIPTDFKGWWAKLGMFQRGIFSKNERILYLDLDTAITGGLDSFASYEGEFAILRDFYRPNGYGSGVMMWQGDTCGHIWNGWQREGMPEIEGGDQAFIEKIHKNADLLQDLFPGQICSYKVSATNMFPKGSKICCFHGIPKPHEITDGWVPHVWKIGGGTTLEMELVANTAETEMAENILFAIKTGKPLLEMKGRHDGHAVIVGGAPSLADCLDEIKLRKEDGQRIFATNNTVSFLRRNKIDADYHVMLDARIENLEFIDDISGAERLYASQCHPEVTKRSDVIWHSYAEGILDVICDDKRNTDLIAGGTTVVLKSIALAYVLGYRIFHLYGVDSSYREGKHHAYPQPLNDSDAIIDVVCNDKAYKTCGWMVAQVDGFKELMGLLVGDCTITVHGDGLLPDVARLMA